RTFSQRNNPQCTPPSPSALWPTESHRNHLLFMRMVLSSPDHTQIFPNHTLKSFKVDFIRVWLKLNWNIKGFSMRVFKWDCVFSPAKGVGYCSSLDPS
ncbi:hypothetical protein Leryth_025599, partial [Lithospermum erythrorhizon]